MRTGLFRTLAVVTTAALAVTAPAANAVTSTAPANSACLVPASTKVSDLTYSELTSKYVLNNGEPIPTLKEFLTYADSVGVGVLPEIKNWDVPAYARYNWAPPGTTGDVTDRTPTALQPELEDYLAQMTAYDRIPTKIIGSFDPSVLQWFKDRPESSSWDRIWFRSVNRIGGSDFVQPGTPPFPQEITTASGAPLTAAAFSPSPLADTYARTYAGTTGGAPAATAIGLLNITWFKGSLSFVETSADVPFDVPTGMADAGIPVYVWFNVLTGGDSAAGSRGVASGIVTNGLYSGDLPSIGWEGSAAYGARWIATDNTAEYKAWASTTTQRVPAMVAHRGGGTPDVSENSMSAFREAVANGASVLETDVQWTKPESGQQIGVAVLMHDETINRTMKCKARSGGPAISALVSGKKNAAGWYRKSPTVRFTCTRGTKPLAGPCPSKVRVKQGRDQKVKRTISDTKGRRASVTVKGLNVDLTPPRVQVRVRPAVPGGPTGADRIVCRAKDRLSGPAGCTVDARQVRGTMYRFTATGRDKAGNKTVVTGKVRVD